MGNWQPIHLNFHHDSGTTGFVQFSDFQWWYFCPYWAMQWPGLDVKTHGKVTFIAYQFFSHGHAPCMQPVPFGSLLTKLFPQINIFVKWVVSDAYTLRSQVHNVGSQVHNVGSQVHHVGSQVHHVGSQVHHVGSQVHHVGSQVHHVGSQVHHVGSQVHIWDPKIGRAHV